MLVGICDFPGDYAFPPIGYGGIERWLWAVAVGARRAGAEVHLLGCKWRPELADEWVLHPVRLKNVLPGEWWAHQLRSTGYDLLVVGHEYPSLLAWQTMRDLLNCDVATFQHWPYFQHRPGTFDGQQTRLYCYSEEMSQRYADDKPTAELAVHLGLHEEEMPAHDSDTLLWLGRIDTEKATHLAIRAAQLLGRKITIAGPVFDTAYVNGHRDLFEADHVRMVGEVGGKTKIQLLAKAGILVYTCARTYIEAGAASFGESLRAGTPVAALAWRSGTCAQAALCDQTGSVALADAELDDEAAARTLADAIDRAGPLRSQDVQEIGLARFDPVQHFQVLATRPC